MYTYVNIDIYITVSTKNSDRNGDWDTKNDIQQG